MAAGLSIPSLLSGGLITNYNCTSKCRHCLYNCSPSRSKDYISPENAFDCFKQAKKAGAASMHIGGGEPMLAPDRIEKVLTAARKAGVHIEYVETNSSWFRNHEQACEILQKLKGKGIGTLLISISPFHMEYIAVSKVLGVIRACRETGIHPFLWMETFLQELLEFNPEKPHRFEYVMTKMGPDYLKRIRQRYWIHEGGRAIKAFEPLYSPKTMEQVLDSADKTCFDALCDTSHFHIDLYGNYIPGLCAGFGIDAKNIGRPLDRDDYPLIHILADSGIRGLVEFARREHGFSDEQKTYTGKCDVCNDVRRFLVDRRYDYRELAPAGYYKDFNL